MSKIIGLKDFRQNVSVYADGVREGKSFIVVRRSRPIFRISKPLEEEWETVIDFTKIRKGGIDASELISRL